LISLIFYLDLSFDILIEFKPFFYFILQLFL
jgi:hypothetical protein